MLNYQGIKEKIKEYTPFKTDINFYGWKNIYSGYGSVFLESSAHLNVVTGDKVSIPFERLTHTDKDWEIATPMMQYLHSKPVIREARVGIMKQTPGFFQEMRNPIKIGYTMTETTAIGKIWRDWINAMDFCFVPSPHLVEVFKESGVKIPVIPVKQGVNTNRFYHLERPFNRPEYTFGILSWMDKRKGWEFLVEAFCNEFDEGEPVRLLVKNTDPRFGYEIPKDRRIKVIHKKLTFKEMLKFYYLLDCYVFPSRGEGCGQTTLEAMATGLPVILTNWSGLAQQCDRNFNIPLEPISFSPHHLYTPGEEEGVCADIDVHELMYWMRWCYENRVAARQMGVTASAYVMENWSYWACAEDMRKTLEKII